MTTPTIKTLTAFRCPLCRDYDNEVKDSRPRSDGYIWRKRYCRSCSSAFSTVEIPVDLWTTGQIDAELSRAAEALTSAVNTFNTLRKAYRSVRKSANAKNIYTREGSDG